MNKTIYKIMIPLIVFVLSAILLTVGLCGYFEKAGNSGYIAEVTDGLGNEILTDGTAQTMPERMVFGVRALAATAPVAETDTSVTLTATVNPLNADNKAVDWRVVWSSPTYEWASEKSVSDYMTVTPQTDGALTATVNCKKAFGEKIKITVTSRDNPSATAECLCDYVKRVTDITVELKKGPKPVNAVELGNNSAYTVSYTPIYADGTIAPTVEMQSCNMQMTEEFISTIQAYQYYLPTTVSRGTTECSSFIADNAFLYQLGGNSQAIQTSLSTFYISGVRDAISKISAKHADITVTVSVQYGELVNDTVTNTLPVKFNADAMAVRVQSVELDRSTLTI